MEYVVLMKRHRQGIVTPIGILGTFKSEEEARSHINDNIYDRFHAYCKEEGVHPSPSESEYWHNSVDNIEYVIIPEKS